MASSRPEFDTAVFRLEMQGRYAQPVTNANGGKQSDVIDARIF